MENLTSKQKTTLLIVGIIIVGLFVFYMFNKMNSINDVILVEDDEQEAKDKTIEVSKIKIHITGAIKNQGVVELESGSRIQDAIDEAGGLTEQADISKVNLAYTLKDGQKIYVPQITDLKNEEIIMNEVSNEIIVDDGVREESKNEKININSASKAELERLTGIGSGTAEKIIEYRKNNGKFNAVEEIKNVSGIGESKYQTIKDYITI